MTYVITVNTAGYLPEGDPFETDDWNDAVTAFRAECERTIDSLYGECGDLAEADLAAQFRDDPPREGQDYSWWWDETAYDGHDEDCSCPTLPLIHRITVQPN